MGLPAGPAVPRLDPTLVAPVGSYLTDGTRLIYVLEVDHSGAIGEDAESDGLVEISPLELPHWRVVIPAA